MRLLPALFAILALSACAPRLMGVGDPVFEPRLDLASPLRAVMADGAHLPLLVFEAESPKAVILGLHGFNDYSNTFGAFGPGEFFASKGIAVYAMDQRGFGGAPGRGLWAGDERMAEDAAAMAALLRERYPGVPLYVLGTSMGGAVAMRMMALPEPPQVDGVILSAPAVWGWQNLNTVYAATLWTAARLAPSAKLTGRGLEIWPSDNIEMLRALGRDPQVIKETKIGTLHGLVTLMDEAYNVAGDIPVPVLLLYGAKDEIVPPRATASALRSMRAGGVAVTAACYPAGYHMLLRDKQRETVWRDIVAWIGTRQAPLPSGNDGDLSPCGPLVEPLPGLR
ncbi:MAG: alpha/beta hydrolase [Alphaproteobacteria bacterium]|nr:alpha/beta hydrolase [Alphaproteobacteria bacterium]MDX5416462.1 alpha/beta hydrolase [Alphaproteobacteria bacterium]MDX5493810.1 alpha/beta hydrolase [Alphaproteobacteria bacterium]